MLIAHHALYLFMSYIYFKEATLEKYRIENAFNFSGRNIYHVWSPLPFKIAPGRASLCIASFTQ